MIAVNSGVRRENGVAVVRVMGLFDAPVLIIFHYRPRRGVSANVWTVRRWCSLTRKRAERAIIASQRTRPFGALRLLGAGSDAHPITPKPGVLGAPVRAARPDSLDKLGTGFSQRKERLLKMTIKTSGLGMGGMPCDLRSQLEYRAGIGSAARLRCAVKVAACVPQQS